MKHYIAELDTSGNTIRMVKDFNGNDWVTEDWHEAISKCGELNCILGDGIGGYEVVSE